MKLVLRFLKPYRRLCGLTILAMLLDVAGGLIVPRLTADMINIGIESGSLSFIIQKGLQCWRPLLRQAQERCWEAGCVRICRQK